MTSPVKNFKDTELITEHNALVHSRQNFSVLQQRILALAISKIQRNHSGDEEYEIPIKELTELGTSSQIYSRLEEETRSLVSKVITHRYKTDNGKNKFVHWSILSKAEHEEDSGKITIRFDPDVREMLFNLTGEFSSAVAVEQASCNSLYGARIYRMLVSHWRHGKWKVSIEELRYKLALESKYKNFSHFRKRVLEKAQSDLKKNTTMRITWKELKSDRGRGKGKKITHIEFKFSWNPGQLKMNFADTPKPTYRIPEYQLATQLTIEVGLTQKEKDRVLKWLDNRPDQDWPMANWIHSNLKGRDPLDAGGRVIRSKSKYFLKHFEETFKKEGFPTPPNTPPSGAQNFKPLIEN